MWEAKLAGFYWKCTDPITLIRQDWHNALKKETWSAHERELNLGEIPDLSQYRDLIHRLRPTSFDVQKCRNVDALKGLTSLQVLSLYDCPTLQNVDALRGLTGLQRLYLKGSLALQNIDALKGLTSLRTLDFTGCCALQNIDALKHLTELRHLVLNHNTILQNIDSLKETLNKAVIV